METDKIFPANWKEIIQGKKVIFYNTGVTSILREQEKRIEKMKWVFDVFKEHPEVVLWWRPHPLEISTIQSMIPELEEQYMEVRRRFKEENIGILDESADLNRAIAVSDAYYGAWSSIVELYKATKKPVLYENNRVKRVADTSFLPVELCIKDGFIWFMQLNSNKLVKMDKNTFEVEKIVSIFSEPPFRYRQYNYQIIDAGSSLLLLLENSCQIYEYEIETDTIKIHRPDIERFIFHSEIVIKKNSKLIMFPYSNNTILEYDYCTNKTIEKVFMKKNICAAKCYEIIDTKAYIVDRNSNILYQYDIVNGSYAIKRIGEQEAKYWGIKKAGKYFVLPHQDKMAITLWNEESGETIVLTKFPEEYMYFKDSAYLDMFEKDGNIYIFPFCANMILRVDVENKSVMQAFENVFFIADYDINSKNLSDEMYLCVKQYQNDIYAFATYKKCWQIFDMDTMRVQDSSLAEIKKIEYKKMIECILNNEIYEGSFCESERSAICNLENYIKNVQNNHIKADSEKADNKGIGSDIYKLLIKEL